MSPVPRRFGEHVLAAEGGAVVPPLTHAAAAPAAALPGRSRAAFPVTHAPAVKFGCGKVRHRPLGIPYHPRPGGGGGGAVGLTDARFRGTMGTGRGRAVLAAPPPPPPESMPASGTLERQPVSNCGPLANRRRLSVNRLSVTRVLPPTASRRHGRKQKKIEETSRS